MIYLYDNAICEDLNRSLDPSSSAEPVVKIMDAEGIMGLVAQMNEDKVRFPLVCLVRDDDTAIDTERTNFTAMHKGMPASVDTEKNTIYMEKCLPIVLSYTMYVLATNSADIDEMLRELLFKYTSMYYLTIQLPYENNRKIRFGVAIDATSVRRTSSTHQYHSQGVLYQAELKLNCEGAVLLSYTPKHMTRIKHGGTVAN